MAVLVDTCTLIDGERDRGVWQRIERVCGAQPWSVSVITASELLFGAERADQRRRASRLAYIERVLSQLNPIPITTDIARTHARLWADLAQAGALIAAHDLWIAATAITLGLQLVTSDADFDRVPGLEVISP